MKKIIYALIFLLPVMLEAQQPNGLSRLQLPKTPRRYYTQKNLQRLLKADSTLARQRAFLEFSMRDLMLSPPTEDITIPVVVHFIYSSSSNKSLPSVNDVRTQIDMVTKDFKQTTKIIQHEADTKEKFSDVNGLDTRISFCLATKTPTGAAFTGVYYVPTVITTWQANDKMKTSYWGGHDAWDTEKYLNIWVVNLPDSVSGYAQMPLGNGPTDGIVIDAKYFGKKIAKNMADTAFRYTEGKTLTHLIGNYLNLYDLWSETTLHGDDGVDDTPIHNAPTVGCVEYRFMSTSKGNPVVMSMNFMDNTNDLCQYMFTIGQKKRMQAMLVKGGPRYKLAQSGNTVCDKTNLQQDVQALQVSPDVVKPAVPSGFNYRLYPNPAQDNINLDIVSDKVDNAELTFFNAQGSIQKQITYTVVEGNQTFNMSTGNWSPGIYLVRLKLGDAVKTEKIIINK